MAEAEAIDLDRSDQSDSCSTDNDSDDDQYYCDLSDCDDHVSSGPEVHPALENDIEILKKFLPTNALRVRSLDSPVLGSDTIMDLDIDVPTLGLKESVTQAWGLVHNKPVTVRLCINPRVYLDADYAQKVEVVQEGSRRRSVLQQLQNIAEQFCRSQFRNLTSKTVETAVTGQTQHRNPPLSQAAQKQMDTEFAELCQMGFEPTDIIAARLQTNGTKENVIDFLLSGQQVDSALRVPPSTVEVATAPAQDPFHIAGDPKQPPSLSQGFLMQLVNYIRQRLLTLNEYCSLCDTKHNEANPMLKPVVCDTPLCQFSYMTMGVMLEVTDYVLDWPRVVYLLLKFTAAASFSARAKSILNPFPTIVDPLQSGEMALHEKNKDYKFLRTLLTTFPRVENLLCSKDMRAYLDKTHVLHFPLLRWIITSCRSHIVPLNSSQRLKCIHTQHQFLVTMSCPSKENRFSEYKKRYGSVFAFHGSPIENWHSIIRQGLIVASGTDKQLHGAVHGKGIYLSPYLFTSMQYAGGFGILKRKEKHNDLEPPSCEGGSHQPAAQPEQPEFANSSPLSLRCVALCEVIPKDSCLVKNKKIWVCSNSDYVCTRFLFVYCTHRPSSASHVNVDLTNPSLMDKIRQAMGDSKEDKEPFEPFSLPETP